MNKKVITIREANRFVRKVCENNNIDYDVMFTKNRLRKYVIPRQICMYLLRVYGGWSVLSIGGYFDKNHATVIHATKQCLSIIDNPYDMYRNMMVEAIEEIEAIKIGEKPSVDKPPVGLLKKIEIIDKKRIVERYKKKNLSSLGKLRSATAQW